MSPKLCPLPCCSLSLGIQRGALLLRATEVFRSAAEITKSDKYTKCATVFYTSKLANLLHIFADSLYPI